MTWINFNPGIRQGWQCPSCRAVYNPDTPMCYKCNGGHGIQTADSSRDFSDWADKYMEGHDLYDGPRASPPIPTPEKTSQGSEKSSGLSNDIIVTAIIMISFAAVMIIMFITGAK